MSNRTFTMRGVRYKHWDMAKIPVGQHLGDQVASFFIMNTCAKINYAKRQKQRLDYVVLPFIDHT